MDPVLRRVPDPEQQLLGERGGEAWRVLEQERAAATVLILTDSAYLANGVNQGWIENWKRKGWVTAAKKPVANRPLWERLDAEIARHHSVRFRHVRGHAGHAENERADRLAQDAALRAVPGTGPGGDSDGQLELGL